MKINKIRVKTFAVVSSGYHNGQVVFLKEKYRGGYMCEGKGYYGFNGWIARKDLKPLTNRLQSDLKAMSLSSYEEYDFYTKALGQLNGTYRCKRIVNEVI